MLGAFFRVVGAFLECVGPRWRSSQTLLTRTRPVRIATGAPSMGPRSACYLAEPSSHAVSSSMEWKVSKEWHRSTPMKPPRPAHPGAPDRELLRDGGPAGPRGATAGGRPRGAGRIALDRGSSRATAEVAHYWQYIVSQIALLSIESV